MFPSFYPLPIRLLNRAESGHMYTRHEPRRVFIREHGRRRWRGTDEVNLE